MHDTYSLMREFADSWALLALFGFFVGALLWVWRPGSRPLHDDAARSIFREEAAPPSLVTGCEKRCASCTCLPREGL